MSKEQLMAFLENLKKDTIAQEKLKTASTPEEVAAIAQEAGFSITAEELALAIDDADLESATGGIILPITAISTLAIAGKCQTGMLRINRC